MNEDNSDNKNIEQELDDINGRLDKVEAKVDLALNESRYAVDKVYELRDAVKFFDVQIPRASKDNVNKK